jgi:hypothetical protein
MRHRRAKVEGKTECSQELVFSVFEAFSFLLDDGSGCVVCQKTMKPSDNAK